MSDPDLKPPQNSLLLPTAGTMPVPTAKPQKLNTGSATGNPRNKCALKPGHSLMDWIRLGSSGEDLSGTRGRVIPVSNEELAKHNTRDNAWMAIRGQVFNVTRYMDFHPGGVEELTRGIGRDATKLFEEVHAWVNYQQLLAKCYIGPLQHIVKVEKDILQQFAKPTKDVFALPSAKQNTDISTEIVPRFDWIQHRGDITFSVYTRQCCNPGLVLRLHNGKELELRVLIEQTSHRFEIALHQSIKWPPKLVRVASETGKIEVGFEKSMQELWASYGSHSVSKAAHTYDLEKDENNTYEVIVMHPLNHDSFAISLQHAGDALMWLPIGFHVSITALLDGSPITRSYTPVAYKYLSRIEASSSAHLHFLIKNYDNGLLSSHLSQLEAGDKLEVSLPKGSFRLKRLLPHRRFTLLAAGSGLTPFLNLIDHLLERNTNRIEHLQLMYFNKTEADIWCKEFLTQLETTDERFHLTNILSQSSEDWEGLKGRITSSLLAPLVDKNSSNYAGYIMACGPTGFNHQVEDILRELGYNEENLFIFQG